MIKFYRIITSLLYPFFILLIILRKFLNKEDRLRYKEKIFSSKFNVLKKKNIPLIWFHAASIGEFKSILPIIENLISGVKSFEFLVTTTTLTSANLAKEELKKFNNVQHRFLPIDIKFLMQNFMNMWKPSAIFLVDSEIWPNLIMTAKEKKIPIMLLNARITSKSFKRWNLISKHAKSIFESFHFSLTSNQETKKFLQKLNGKNIFYTGNIKLASKIYLNKNLNKDYLIKNKFWFAASSHDGEEIFFLKTHQKLKKKFEKITTIIAPRHISRVQSIKKLCDRFNFKSQILNKNEYILEDNEIIIINSFGELASYFECAKSVFIGKSLLKRLERVGGQNPVDAAKLGCKIYHGPFVYNFEEIYSILEKNKISNKIETVDELAESLFIDLEQTKKNTQRFSDKMDNLGKKTLTDTMSYINNFLLNEIK
ncbi:glycosyltransferase N-terminal domain-containing protein [Pelagibacteraceae bacterium]|nr:glycosyltransferase N-terminal domain-containing protein [Pelagibacteraceae bacterium]